jgi:hypothetical protein
VFTSGTETIADAARRWRTLIARDLANMRANGSPFRSGKTRDPLLGFLDLDRDLVIALRDSACLAWGAVDIGSGVDGSGDIMHFDDRVCGIGRALADVGGNTRPRSGHPCVDCGAPPVATQELELDEATPESEQSWDAEESEVWQADDEGEAPVDAVEMEVLEGEAGEWYTGEAVEAVESESPGQEDFLGDLGRLLSPGALIERVRQLLGEGSFGLGLLSRFGAGRIWNEDHLALEVLFHRQPTLRPGDLDALPETKRLQRLRALAIKHQRTLTEIRERTVRPIFGLPANFQVGSADGCRIQDLREAIRRLGPLKGGVINGKVWYKRSAGASPRKQAMVDSIVLHHMAYNIGNDVKSYLKVGAHYAVLADGQVAQLYDDLDFLNAANGFNARSISIELAGNFPSLSYHWWKHRDQTIPDRCYLTPAQINAGRCLLATLKFRLPGIRYLYAHRQSSASRESDPGPDVWLNVGEWGIASLGLTDRLPRTRVGDGRPIPDDWRRARSPTTPAPAPAPARAPTPSGTSGGKSMVVVAGVLNVRATPSVQAAKVGSLKRGDVVAWLDTSPDSRWARIQRGALTGWSAREYLSTHQATAGSDLARYGR